MALDTNATFSNPTLTATRHQYLVLQPWQTDRLEAIKAANPNTKVLVHKNLSGALTSSNSGLYSSGVSYQQADTTHPEWFLKDSSGSRITFQGFNSLYGMDVGNSGYQQAWADNVIKELVRDGWDGVLMDNTDTTMKFDFAQYPTKYPTDSEWRTATESALAYIGPRIQAAGKLAIPNIGAWGGNPEVGRSWLKYVSGGMDEMFAKWGNTAGDGYAVEGRWQAGLDSLKYAQQQGKAFLAVTHSANSDGAAARYGWATTLLGASGRAAFALHGDYTNETWFPEYDYDIGEPTGSESKDSNGVHRRVFSNGIVVVNPTSSALSANLGGTYSGSGLTKVSSVKLSAHSAYILVRDGSGTTIKPGNKKVKSGTVIAKGKLVGGALASTTTVTLDLSRRGDASAQSSVRVRKHGRFKGRIRIERPGNYKLSASCSACPGKHGWPGRVKVRRKQLRA